MKMRFVFFAFLAVLVSSNITAQEKESRRGRPRISEEEREKIEAMINWKLINYLELDDETSDKLLPLMKEFNEERHSLFLEHRKVVNKLFELSENPDITKDDVKSELKSLEDFHRLMQKSRTNLYNKAKSFLTDRQYIRLLIFEQKLKDDMMRQFRGRHDSHDRDEGEMPEN